MELCQNERFNHVAISSSGSQGDQNPLGARLIVVTVSESTRVRREKTHPEIVRPRKADIHLIDEELLGVILPGLPVLLTQGQKFVHNQMECIGDEGVCKDCLSRIESINQTTQGTMAETRD